MNKFTCPVKNETYDMETIWTMMDFPKERIFLNFHHQGIEGSIQDSHFEWEQVKGKQPVLYATHWKFIRFDEESNLVFELASDLHNLLGQLAIERMQFEPAPFKEYWWATPLGFLKKEEQFDTRTKKTTTRFEPTALKVHEWTMHENGMFSHFRVFERLGRWGSCVCCRRDGRGDYYPEFCEWTKRYDHQLTLKSLVEQYGNGYTRTQEKLNTQYAEREAETQREYSNKN